MCQPLLQTLTGHALLGTNNLEPHVPNLKSLLNKDYVPPELDTLQELHYCLACVDQASGSISNFAYDVEMYSLTGTMWALSPLFDYVDDLYSWARANGFTQYSETEMFVVRRG